MSRTITSYWRHHILAANITSNLGRALSALQLQLRCIQYYHVVLHSLAQPSSIFHRSAIIQTRNPPGQSNASSDLTHAHPPPIASDLCTPPTLRIPAKHVPGLVALADLLAGAWTPRKLQRIKLGNFLRRLLRKARAKGQSQGTAKAQPRHN